MGTLDDGWGNEKDFFAPTLVQIGLTYRCNLNCPHCYALYRRTKPEFTELQVYQLIDEAYGLGTSKIVYSHGENLIRKDFHSIASYISKKGIFQTLMSNGFYLQTLGDVKRLEDTGIQKVMISLDSVDPTEHTNNRGNKSAYGWAVSAIEQLKSHTQMKIGISMAIDRRNFGRIQEMAEFATSLGVDHLSYMQVRPNQPESFQHYDWSDYEKICHNLYELVIKNRSRLDVYTHDPFMLTLADERLNEGELADFEAHNVCNAGQRMMSIAPDGDVSGCNFIERSVGNWHETSLSDIWDQLVNDCATDTGDSPCKDCSGFNQCRTGCKAFFLPWEGGYDRRCYSQRFAESTSPMKRK